MSDLQARSYSGGVEPNRPEAMGLAEADLVYGSLADEVLDDQGFIAHWQKLYDKCPHATAYQSPGFVRAWYRTYRAEWEPVIVRSVDARGDFLGLWLLAYEANASVLSHAGAHQAEYHVWLAIPGSDAAFLIDAWTRINKHFVFSSLQFKYLPSAELCNVLRSILGRVSRVSVQMHSRPLVALDSPDVQSLLSKQSYKRRINGLKRLGVYQFRRLTRSEDLNEVFDDLIAYYDFRQSAANQCAPFREDRNKKAFLTDLFSSANDETYVTVACLNQQPIAAFWGSISSKTVHLGMLIYSPFLGKYSLGKVHVSQLCDDLRKAGFDVLDLTPGDDPWKDDFATRHDQVVEAVVYRSQWLHFRNAAIANLLRLGKFCLAKLGISPATAKSAIHAMSRVRPKKMSRRVKAWLGSRREMRVYRAGRDLATCCSLDKRVRRNSLQDLVCFEAGEPWQTRDDFLSRSYARLEHGEFVYTTCIGERLAHYGWMVIGQTNSFMTEVKQSIIYPPGSATFYDFYSDPAFRGRGLYRVTLGCMLAEAFADDRVQRVYISVLADNAASRHVVEAMGFTYVGSAYWRFRFGRESKWMDPLLTRSLLATAD